MPPKTRGTTKKYSKGASTSSHRVRIKRARAPTPSPSPPPSTHLEPLPRPLTHIEHIDRYRVLSSREIIPTRYVDDDTLKTLGLFDEVMSYIDAVGWRSFVQQRFPTYKELTLEFLSSLSINFNPDNELDILTVTFQCMGIEHTLTLAQISHILGIPTRGVQFLQPSFIAVHAWHRLTGRADYHPSRSKSSSLRSHALRYIHRYMSHSLFGRGESHGVVNKNELFFLDSMVEGRQVCTAFWLLRHISHVINNKSGKICVGGFITCIAHALGFIYEEGRDTLVRGSDKVDKTTLVHMGMCTYLTNGQFTLLDGEGHAMQSHPNIIQSCTSTADADPRSHVPDIPVSEPPPIPMLPGSSSSAPHSPFHSTAGWTIDSMMTTLLGRMDALQTSLDEHVRHTNAELATLQAAVANLAINSDEDND